MKTGELNVKGDLYYGGDRLIQELPAIQALDSATKCLIFGDSIGESSGKAVTAVGTAAVSTAQYKFVELGRSILFDGNSDCVTLADSADWDLGAGDFTIDMWIRISSLQDCAFYEQYADADNWIKFVYNNTAHVLNFGAGTTALGYVYSFAIPFTPSADIWYHIAAVRNGTADANWMMFVDGVKGSATKYGGSADATMPNLAVVAGFGRSQVDTYWMNGYISCARVTKGTALWTTNFTPPVYSDYKGARTVYVFSGLDGDVDEEYRLISRVVSENASGSNNWLRLNNDSGTNYGYQNISGADSTASAARNTGYNQGFSLGSAASVGSLCFSEKIIYAKSGYVRTALTKVSATISTTTITSIQLRGESWNNTADNVTSMVAYADGINGFGVGTHLHLFKRTMTGLEASTGMKTGTLDVRGQLKAGVFQLVERYEVTDSAATSKTFSGLAGNTDEVYLIKARFVSGAANANFGVRINNDSTAGIYGNQKLTGNNATVAAARDTSEAWMWLTNTADNDANELAIAEMLLYAKSGYVRACLVVSAEKISTTTVTQVNLYGQSYNETATEITSLVVLSDQADGLGVGTVTELYTLRKYS